MAILPRIPDLMPTETFQSFVARLAAANGAESLRAFRRHFSLKSHKSISSAEVIASVSKLSGLPIPLLFSRRLFIMSGHGEQGHEKLQWTNIHTSSPRYCPLCIMQDLQEGEAAWQIRPWMRGHRHALNNFVCVEHSVPLYKSATAYTDETRWDFTRYCREQAVEVDSAIRDASRVDLHPYDRYFAERLTGQAMSAEFLDPLPYHVAYRLCEIVGRMERSDDGKINEPTEPGRIHVALCEGFTILTEPQKLRSFLTELNKRHLNREKSSSKFYIYGSFERYLSHLITYDCIRPLIDLVREHAMDALPIGPEDNFLGGGGVRKWHTLRTAQLKLGIDARSMRKIAVERGLIAADQMHLRDNNILLPSGDVEQLARVFQNAVDLQYVKSTLGVLEQTARTLVEEGVILPGVGSTPKMKAKFSKPDIDGLLIRLTEGVDPCQNETGFLSLVDAARKGGGSVANLIVALASGKLTARYLSSDPQRGGLMRLLLDPQEVRDLFVHADGIKRQDFAKVFPFRPLEADKLFYSDFFERVQEVSPTNHVRYDAVTRDSFEAFQRGHITLAKLASGRARPIEVRRELEKAGISPVWEIKGRRALTFYRREDVAPFQPRS
ncbi:hypothetical protein F4V91_14745 [Neorhizobium galegae]|uniref:TniQ domain-containing protein n=1 Tax=Neorhizobium galegae TaxID=399 RepID=A0A6A1TTK5_NEOGA|nr:TniQ family protein [Neorhizobium galegae]KAB1087576.1 hypothetical protein F4V91_14745 [Neorhizobium galegae]